MISNFFKTIKISYFFSQNLFFLDDPSTITLDNGVTIGTTSADILVHISNEEVVK